MENASKALIIAGAILLSILIIAIGIYVFNQANSTITSSMSSMNTQEKEAFNNNFTTYQGDAQSGSNVKALLTRVSANLDTYQDEAEKVMEVGLFMKADTATTLAASVNYTTNAYNQTNQATSYAKTISAIRNQIKDKHTYAVMMNTGSSGLVCVIAIGDVTNMSSSQVDTAKGTMQNWLDTKTE